MNKERNFTFISEDGGDEETVNLSYHLTYSVAGQSTWWLDLSSANCDFLCVADLKTIVDELERLNNESI